MGVEGKIFEAKFSTAGHRQMHVGKRLRDLRQLAGATQLELAKRLNIDQTAVSNSNIATTYVCPPYVDTSKHLGPR